MATAIDSSGAPTGGFSGLLSQNPNLLSGAAGLAGVGLSSLLSSGDKLPFEGALTSSAGGITAQAGNIVGEAQVAQERQGQLFGTGTDLLSSIQSGQLPPGAEQSVQNQINQSIQTVKARYAALGQTGSTMEADAIANIQNQATALRFSIAQQMAQLGEATIGESLRALGISQQGFTSAGQLFGEQAKVFSDLMAAQMKQDASTQDTIGKFASAIGGSFAKAIPGLSSLGGSAGSAGSTAATLTEDALLAIP